MGIEQFPLMFGRGGFFRHLCPTESREITTILLFLLLRKIPAPRACRRAKDNDDENVIMRMTVAEKANPAHVASEQKLQSVSQSVRSSWQRPIYVSWPPKMIEPGAYMLP